MGQVFTVSINEDVTTSVGNLLQYLVLLTAEFFFLMFRWNLLSSFFSHCLLTCNWTLLRRTWFCPPSSLSLSFYQRCSMQSLTFWCFAGLFQVCACFSYTGEPRNKSRISNVASVELNGGKGSPSLTIWQCSSSCSLVCYCLPLLQTGTDDELNLTTRMPIRFLECFFPACCSPSCTGAWVYSSRIWHFSLLNSMRFLFAHFSSLRCSFQWQPNEAWCIIQSSQCHIVCSLAECTLDPLFDEMNEEVKHCLTHTWPMGYTINDWPLTRLCATIHNLLNLPVKSSCDSHPCLLTYLVLHPLSYECVTRDGIKSLTEVKINNFHCFSLTSQASNITVEGYWVGHIHKSMMTAPEHLLVLHVSGNGFQN